MDCDLDELQATTEAVRTSIALAKEIEDVVTRQVGASQAPDLSAFPDQLRQVEHVLKARLESRGVVETAVPAAGGAEPGAAAAPAAGAAPGAAPTAGGAFSMSGEITTREQAVQTLDRVIEYFKRYEPSSPIPLLLARAKRLVSKSFMEIMRDLAPDGLAQAQLFGGASAEGEGS
jgi:type VI secretion system protein ImpA